MNDRVVWVREPASDGGVVASEYPPARRARREHARRRARRRWGLAVTGVACAGLVAGFAVFRVQSSANRSPARATQAPETEGVPAPGFSGDPAAYNLPVDACAMFSDGELATLTGWASGSFARTPQLAQGSCGVSSAKAGQEASLGWTVQAASSPVIETIFSGGWGTTTSVAGTGDRAVRVDQDLLGMLVVVQGDRALIIQFAAPVDAARNETLGRVGTAGVAALARK